MQDDMKSNHNSQDDYCDLDPTKLCDNCCKCLDTEKDYRVVTADFLIDSVVDEADLELDDNGFFDELELEIDPALKAEWEAKLAAYQDTQDQEFPMLNIGTRQGHAARKKPGAAKK